MWVKILLLIFVFSFLFRTDHSFDQDLGRHLRLGEIILQTNNVPLVNLSSYTHPDFPFINSHWLFEVMVFLGQQTIGLQAVLFLKIIIFLLAVWLILSVIPKNQYLLLPIGYIFLHVFRERPELRPEIFSFLFTGLVIFILYKFEKTKSRLIYLLPFIQLIWVNTHIYFIVGIFLLFIYLAHFAFYRKAKEFKLLLAITFISVILTLINPSGLKGALNPLQFNSNYGYTIVENQTMFLLESIGFRDPNFLFVKLSCAIIILSILIAIFKRRLLVKNLGLAGLGLTLALLNVRSFPYLVLISLPAVLENFGTGKLTVIHRILILITIPILIYESFLYLNGDYYRYTDSDTRSGIEFKESGRKTLDFVLANNLPQPIFNNFDIGSYITYRGWPKYRVFVDGRPGEYPKEFFQTVYIPMQSDSQKFKEVDQKYGFKTIIFSHTDQTPWGKAFLASIVKNNDWRIVYIDDFMIVLVKAGIAEEKGIKIIDLAKLQASEFELKNHRSYLNLSIFLISTGNLQSAATFAEAAIKIFPQSPAANAMLPGYNASITSPNIFW